MGWVQRSLLWTLDKHEHMEEYVFVSDTPAAGWHPASLTTLSNGDRTMTGGRAVVSRTYDYLLPGGAFNPVAWVAELTIDSVGAGMSVGGTRQVGPLNPLGFTGTCFWKANGDYCINYGQQATSAWPYTTGDKLGLATIGESVWWFKNGVLKGSGLGQYYSGPPFDAFCVAGSGGSATINCDLSSMAYQAQYLAVLPTVIGWPS